jgi:hypothetical protein
VAEVLEPFVTPVTDVLEPVLTPVTEVLQPVVAPVVEVLAPAVQPIVETVQPIVEPIVAPIHPVIDPVVNVIQPNVNPIVEPVQPVLGPVVGHGPIVTPSAPVVSVGMPQPQTLPAPMPAPVTSVEPASISGVTATIPDQIALATPATDIVPESAIMVAEDESIATPAAVPSTASADVTVAPGPTPAVMIPVQATAAVQVTVAVEQPIAVPDAPNDTALGATPAAVTTTVETIAATDVAITAGGMLHPAPAVGLRPLPRTAATALARTITSIADARQDERRRPRSRGRYRRSRTPSSMPSR